jgi:hypothetical protein
MTTTTKKITITMSETAPVSIDPEQWPVIASASDHDGKVEVQANTEWAIKVREHRDGRRLVYGHAERGNGGKPAGWRPSYAGWLIPSVDLETFRPLYDGGPMTAAHPDETATIRAIRRVAGVIGREDLAAECIGDLPAKDL